MFNNFEQIVLLTLMICSLINCARIESERYSVDLNFYYKNYINYININFQFFKTQSILIVSKIYFYLITYGFIVELYKFIYTNKCLEIIVSFFYITKLTNSNFIYEYVIQCSYDDFLRNILFISILKSTYAYFMAYLCFLIIIFISLSFLGKINQNNKYMIYKRMDILNMIKLIVIISITFYLIRFSSILYLDYLVNKANNYILFTIISSFGIKLIRNFIEYYCCLLCFICSYFYIYREY